MASVPLTHLAAPWERCKISVQGETLDPAPPFLPYNLFDFYFPSGHAPDRSQRSLPYEFLSVDTPQVDAIVDFCQRFGLLRVVDDGKGPSIVDACAGDETTPEELEEFPPWSLARARLNQYGDTPSPPGGFRSLTVEEFRTAQEHLRKAMSWAQAWQQARSREEARTARFKLRELVNPHLRFVYPRLQWEAKRSRWVTGWDIRSLEAAMYLMLQLDLQGPGLIRTCPWDQTIFLGDERTRYCSLRCQNAHNVQQFRQRTRPEPSHRSQAPRHRKSQRKHARKRRKRS
ncbi:MAG TPA: hypothetical protein VEI50_14085 [Nitrospiraceae bacterium]|nr:hypothetical protein [Nitrospiraceae bacterium]